MTNSNDDDRSLDELRAYSEALKELVPGTGGGLGIVPTLRAALNAIRPVLADSVPRRAPAHSGEPPAIVPNTRKKRLKLLRAERTMEQGDDPEATARVKAFLACMILPGGTLPPQKR